jgi:hypothetical protein
VYQNNLLNQKALVLINWTKGIMRFRILVGQKAGQAGDLNILTYFEEGVTARKNIFKFS